MEQRVRPRADSAPTRAIVEGMRRLALLVVLSGCSFDARIPPERLVACVDNADCPRGSGCRLPFKRCEAGPANDETPPGLLRVSLGYEAPGFPPLTALGPASTATLSVEPTEPLSAVELLPPLGVDCAGPDWRETTLTFTCTVRGPVSEGAQPISLALTDLAGRSATVAVPEPLVVDTSPPGALAGPLMIELAPFLSPPVRELRLSPVPPGHFGVLLAEESLLAVAQSLDGGVRLPVEGLAPARVVVADGAANRSTPTPVLGVRESLRGPYTPHRAFLFASLGPARTSGRDWFEVSARDGEQFAPAIPMRRGSAWIRHKFELPTTQDLRFVAAVDEGLLYAVSQSGPPEVWRWTWGGFEQVEAASLAGSPPSATGVAFGYDRQRRQIVRVGGTLTATDRRAWIWVLRNGVWQRLPPDLASAAVDEPMLEWSSLGLLLMGGQRSEGLTDAVEVFTGAQFVPLLAGSTPVRLPQPRRRAATTFETLTGSTWLFGGLVGANQPTNELIRFTAARGFEVIPRTTPWPAPAEHALLVPEASGLLLARAVQDTATTATVEFWAFTEPARFVRLSQRTLWVRSVSLGWDPERSALLVFDAVTPGATVWAVDARTGAATILKREPVSPEPRRRAGFSFSAVDDRGLLYGGVVDGQETDEAWLLSSERWEPLPPGPGRRAWHAAWNDASGLVVMGGTADGGALTSAARYERGTWRALPWSMGDGLPLGPAAGLVASRRDAGREVQLVVREHDDRLFQLAADEFRFGGPLGQRLPSDGGVSRPRSLQTDEGVFIVGSEGASTVGFEVSTLRTQRLSQSLLGLDRAVCFDDGLGSIVAVNGFTGSSDAGAIAIDDLRELPVGGRVPSPFGNTGETVAISDAWGDGVPRPARSSAMARVQGRCWLVNNQQVLEAWELRSDASNPGIAWRISVPALSGGPGRRRLRLTFAPNTPAQCWAHVDGSWWPVSRAPDCVIEERFLPAGVDSWTVAFTVATGTADRQRLVIEPPSLQAELVFE